MTEEEKELEMWRNEWQSSVDGRGSRTSSMLVFDATAITSGRNLVLNVLGAIASTVGIAGLTIAHRGSVVVVACCVMVCVFNAVSLTRLFTLRAGTMKAAGVGLDVFVELTRTRLDADLRWNRFTERLLYALVVFVVPWLAAILATHAPLFVVDPWRAAAGFGSIAGVMVWAFVWTRRQRAKILANRAELERLVADRTAD